MPYSPYVPYTCLKQFLRPIKKLSGLRKILIFLMAYSEKKYKNAIIHFRGSLMPGCLSNIYTCTKCLCCMHTKVAHNLSRPPSSSHMISSCTFPLPFQPTSHDPLSYGSISSNYARPRHSRLWRTFIRLSNCAPTCSNTRINISLDREPTHIVRTSLSKFTGR